MTNITAPAYKFKSNTKWFIIISLIFLVLCYYGTVCWENSVSSEYLNLVANGNIPENTFVFDFISFLQSLLTILFSIIISSLFATLFFEKRSKNKIYSDALNDIVDSSKIILNVDDKNYIDSTLTTALPCKNLPNDLIETVSKKIFFTSDEYYYENCKVDIVCKVNGDFLEKEIKKEMYLLSYEPEFKFDNDNPLIFVKQATKPGIDDQLTCLEIHITNNTFNGKVSKTEYSITSESLNDPISIKQGFTSQKSLVLTEPLTINNNKPTKVTIRYKTKTNIDDLDYIFRVPCACKTLDFNFRMDSKGYKVSGYAFGFLDDAHSSINSSGDQVIQYKFENWIFKRDGISVNIKNI